MKKLVKNSQKGFSLIELILYMAILSILMIALFQLLTSIFDVQLESQATASVTSDGRYILNKLGYDITRADAVISPSVGNQGANLVFTDGSETYTYSLASGNLMLLATPSGTQDRLNGYNTSVSDISFLRLSDISGELDTITVIFTLNSVVARRGGQESETFRTTIGTR